MSGGTNVLDSVGARDACASKNTVRTPSLFLYLHLSFRLISLLPILADHPFLADGLHLVPISVALGGCIIFCRFLQKCISPPFYLAFAH